MNKKTENIFTFWVMERKNHEYWKVQLKTKKSILKA